MSKSKRKGKRLSRLMFVCHLARVKFCGIVLSQLHINGRHQVVL